MSPLDDRELQPPILPELEHLLLHAARRRKATRFGRRRWALAIAAAALLLAAGAAATTGVLHVADGHTRKGTFSIESRPVPTNAAGEPPRGSVCLQLLYNEGGASYGCGGRPASARPFGLLVADSLEEGSRERVIYGLVAADIARISVLGDGGEHTDAVTEAKQGLPGRFFAVSVPHLGRIELVGYDSLGNERARIGSLAPPTHPPHSKAEAVAQGDPAGFAPTVAPPSSFKYQGKSITAAEAVRRQFVCVQDSAEFRCYDRPAEAEADRENQRGN
jgi:hypothetical protein